MDLTVILAISAGAAFATAMRSVIRGRRQRGGGVNSTGPAQRASSPDLEGANARQPTDDVELANRLRKEAEAGSAESQNMLGGMYAEGRGVPQDYAQAAKWCRIAADQASLLLN